MQDAAAHLVLSSGGAGASVGLYKIFVHFNVFGNEPIIVLLPPHL